MSAARPKGSIPVGVVVERRSATSPWLDAVWRPVSLLTGVPEAAPWTMLSAAEDVATFFAGAGSIVLYESETEHYRSNLAAETPSIWVALRPTGTVPPYELFAVTANPAEGEAFTQAGHDLVDAVPMPAQLRRFIEAFVVEHYVEPQPAYRRNRATADLEGAAHRGPMRRRQSR